MLCRTSRVLRDYHARLLCYNVIVIVGMQYLTETGPPDTSVREQMWQSSGIWRHQDREKTFLTPSVPWRFKRRMFM